MQNGISFYDFLEPSEPDKWQKISSFKIFKKKPQKTGETVEPQPSPQAAAPSPIPTTEQHTEDIELITFNPEDIKITTPDTDDIDFITFDPEDIKQQPETIEVEEPEEIEEKIDVTPQPEDIKEEEPEVKEPTERPTPEIEEEAPEEKPAPEEEATEETEEEDEEEESDETVGSELTLYDRSKRKRQESTKARQIMSKAVEKGFKELKEDINIHKYNISKFIRKARSTVALHKQLEIVRDFIAKVSSLETREIAEILKNPQEIKKIIAELPSIKGLSDKEKKIGEAFIQRFNYSKSDGNFKAIMEELNKKHNELIRSGVMEDARNLLVKIGLIRYAMLEEATKLIEAYNKSIEDYKGGRINIVQRGLSEFPKSKALVEKAGEYIKKKTNKDEIVGSIEIPKRTPNIEETMLQLHEAFFRLSQIHLEDDITKQKEAKDTLEELQKRIDKGVKDIGLLKNVVDYLRSNYSLVTDYIMEKFTEKSAETGREMTPERNIMLKIEQKIMNNFELKNMYYYILTNLEPEGELIEEYEKESKAREEEITASMDTLFEKKGESYNSVQLTIGGTEGVTPDNVYNLVKEYVQNEMLGTPVVQDGEIKFIVPLDGYTSDIFGYLEVIQRNKSINEVINTRLYDRLALEYIEDLFLPLLNISKEGGRYKIIGELTDEAIQKINRYSSNVGICAENLMRIYEAIEIIEAENDKIIFSDTGPVYASALKESKWEKIVIALFKGLTDTGSIEKIKDSKEKEEALKIQSQFIANLADKTILFSFENEDEIKRETKPLINIYVLFAPLANAIHKSGTSFVDGYENLRKNAELKKKNGEKYEKYSAFRIPTILQRLVSAFKEQAEEPPEGGYEKVAHKIRSDTYNQFVNIVDEMTDQIERTIKEKEETDKPRTEMAKIITNGILKAFIVYVITKNEDIAYQEIRKLFDQNTKTNQKILNEVTDIFFSMVNDYEELHRVIDELYKTETQASTLGASLLSGFADGFLSVIRDMTKKFKGIYKRERNNAMLDITGIAKGIEVPHEIMRYIRKEDEQESEEEQPEQTTIPSIIREIFKAKSSVSIIIDKKKIEKPLNGTRYLTDKILLGTGRYEIKGDAAEELEKRRTFLKEQIKKYEPMMSKVLFAPLETLIKTKLEKEEDRPFSFLFVHDLIHRIISQDGISLPKAAFVSTMIGDILGQHEDTSVTISTQLQEMPIYLKGTEKEEIESIIEQIYKQIIGKEVKIRKRIKNSIERMKILKYNIYKNIVKLYLTIFTNSRKHFG